jgi:hypothetical protein
MVGRDDTVQQLARRLREQRFVSIIGAGGIGKTTVALAVAHEVLSEFPGAVHFFDLAAREDPRLVAGALASELGISVVSDNPLPAILAFLGEQRTLLLFDSCEHVIEVVAALAENIFREALRFTFSQRAGSHSGRRVSKSTICRRSVSTTQLGITVSNASTRLPGGAAVRQPDCRQLSYVRTER